MSRDSDTDSDSVTVFLSVFGSLDSLPEFVFQPKLCPIFPNFWFFLFFLELLCGQVLAAMASLSENSLFNIEKLDGTNFPFWKEQIYNVLVQKKQARPIKLKGVKPEGMLDIDWQEMDELARSTIMLTLSKSVYFNVKEMKTSFELWQKLCDLYEKKSAASQVYWLKQLVDLKMTEGTSMSSHLNEFNTIFSQLSAKEIKFDDSVKAIFLLVTLPESWDTFRTAVSNSAPASGLTSANVESSLLTEEVNRKNLDSSRGSNALVVRGRSNDRGKSTKRGKSHSKSHG